MEGAICFPSRLKSTLEKTCQAVDKLFLNYETVYNKSTMITNWDSDLKKWFDVFALHIRRIRTIIYKNELRRGGIPEDVLKQVKYWRHIMKWSHGTASIPHKARRWNQQDRKIFLLAMLLHRRRKKYELSMKLLEWLKAVNLSDVIMPSWNLIHWELSNRQYWSFEKNYDWNRKGKQGGKG